MLRYYESTDTLERLRTDKHGVVSFEYVIVAAFIVVVLGAAFKAAANGPIKDAMTSGMSKVVIAVSTLGGG